MLVVRDVADSNVVVCSCPPMRTRAVGVKPLPVSRNKSGVAFGFATFVGRGTRAHRKSQIFRACHLLYYYLLVNYAMVLAWINVFRGRPVTIWVPERKEA